MRTLSKEEFTEAYDKLSDELKSAITSDSINSVLNNILESNHLNAEKALEFRKITTAVMFGIVHPENIESEAIEKTHIDPRAAKLIADSIRFKVLSQVAIHLNKSYGFHLIPMDPMKAAKINEAIHLDTEVPKKTEVSKEVEGISHQQIPSPEGFVSEAEPQEVDPQKESDSGSLPPAGPAMLHHHEGVDSQPQNNGYPGGLVRPSFYEPPSGTSSSEGTAPSPQARLEIGKNVSEIQPIMRVGKEDTNIVHYSSPEEPSNPFSTRNEKIDSPAEEKRNIPNDNVVNLKDLPQ